MQNCVEWSWEHKKMSKMNYQFVLIGKTQARWSLVLAEALEFLGRLHVVSEQDAEQMDAWVDFDAIIIDAGTVSDAIEMITRLRNRAPNARVVVATAAPTWQLARAALQAGAADYIRKSLDKKELGQAIKEVVELPPPPWPQ